MTQDKLHIVFNAMSLQRGGGLTVILGLLNGFSKSQKSPFKLTVVCCADATKEAIEAQGVADEVLQFCQNANLLKRQIWMKWTLPKLVKSLDADVFFTINQYVSGIDAPQLVYHLNLLRFMPVQHGQGVVHHVLELIRNRASKLALIKAQSNVFESEFLAESALKVHARKSELDRVIYIGLPDDLLSIPKVAFDSRNQSKLFSITSPIPHKDNPTLIRTLAELVKLRPEVDWNLEIAGGFEALWASHKSLAKELSVYDRITWLGFISQEELTHYLQRSLCLISTSIVESFCMVGLESMGRGCPAIVSNCTSMPESVGDAALLATPGDPGSFADAVLQIYDNPSLRNSRVEKGYEWIQNFGWQKCGDQFTELLKEMHKAFIRDRSEGGIA